MFRILLVICVLFPCVVLAQDSNQPIEDASIAEPSATETNQQATDSNNNSDSIGSLNPVANDQAADGSENRTQSGSAPNASNASTLDLIEQTRMAVGTESIAVDTSTQVEIAIGGIILNIVGLFILGIALVYNIRATNAATKSADAALLAIHGNRAWVTFMDLENCGFLDSNASQSGSPAFTFKLVNTGDTPARNISICAMQSTCLRESESEIIQPPPTGAYKETGSVGFLGKGASYTTVVTPFHEDWFRYVKDNTHDITFSLRVTYETVHAGVQGCTILCKRVSHEQRTSRMYSVTIGHCCSLE